MQALTALFHPEYKLLDSFISSLADQLPFTFQCLAMSSLDFQNPTASPAKYAAPNAVVSFVS